MKPFEIQNKLGVKETVELFQGLTAIGNAVHDVTDPESPAGTSVSFLEYPTFLQIIPALQPMISGLSQVPKEAADEITDEEKQKIKDVVMQSKYAQNIDNFDEWFSDHLDAIVVLKHLMQKWYFHPKVKESLLKNLENKL